MCISLLALRRPGLSGVGSIGVFPSVLYALKVELSGHVPSCVSTPRPVVREEAVAVRTCKHGAAGGLLCISLEFIYILSHSRRIPGNLKSKAQICNKSLHKGDEDEEEARVLFPSGSVLE